MEGAQGELTAANTKVRALKVRELELPDTLGKNHEEGSCSH